MNIFSRILAKWFELEPEMCQGCEILRSELEANRRLLELVMQKPPEVIENRPTPEPLRVKNIPWNVRRQMLEEQDRKRAAEIKDLEKELGVASNFKKG
jgi:hypothetical protein